MKAVNLHLMGRWGNMLFQYAAARAHCEKYGYELRTDPWIGQEIFQLKDAPITERFPLRNEETWQPGEGDVGLQGYFQMQKFLYTYSRHDCLRWFKWRPEIKVILEKAFPKPFECVAHIRRGDYAESGYPIISLLSYSIAAEKFNLGPVEFISEERPHTREGLPVGMDFLPDFYLMAQAKTLLRANSSFSWWAAALGRDGQQAFSPIIDKALGGKESDVEFTQGNWPRLANLPFVTDLLLRP